MDYIFAAMMLLGGVGAFLVGVKALSDNTERLANSKIKTLLNKTSKSRFFGVGIGVILTAIVQSSGITTVMVVGLVNAGVMTLFQATSVILGANIGTTITAFISALSAFKILKYSMMALAFFGIFANMLSKNEKVKTIGYAFAGLGLVFVGLEFMKSAMLEMQDPLTSMLEVLKNPFLLVAIGIFLTVITQSSSVVTSVLVVMAGAGLTVGGGGNAVLFVVLGANIGSTSTSLISSIGASANAKRAGIIHLLMKIVGALPFFILFMCWPDFMDVTFAKWFAGAPEMQIAMFHTSFNIICTLAFLPFVGGFVKLSQLIVRDKAETDVGDVYLDVRFLKTPGVALDTMTRNMLGLLDLSMGSLKTSLDGFLARDEGKTKEVAAYNERVANACKLTTDYLIRVSSQNIAVNEEKLISALHNNIGDIMRISELADNITKYTRRTINDGLEFSPYVSGRLQEMYEKLFALATLTKQFVLTRNYILITEIDKAEDEIDNMRKSLIKDHIARLNNGECRAESSSVFINLVCNLERVGDHINYVAHAFLELGA